MTTIEIKKNSEYNELTKIFGEIQIYYDNNCVNLFIEKMDGFPYGFYINLKKKTCYILECGCDQ